MAVRFAIICLTLLALAGCQLLAAPQQADTTLWPLQIAIENQLSAGEAGAQSSEAESPAAERPAGQGRATQTSDGGATISVAVLSVVDSSALASAESAGSDQPLDSDALRRERLVQQALSGALVTNSLIEVVQPDQASIDLARAEIIAINSAALSPPTAGQIGEQLGADVLVCALIDRQGAEVNIIAQRASDGKLLYQDTIKDWDVLAAPAETSE